MANPTTFDYVSERRLLYFTQALKAKIPEAGAVIDDTVAALNKVYSSSKVESLITSATGAMLRISRLLCGTLLTLSGLIVKTILLALMK